MDIVEIGSHVGEKVTFESQIADPFKKRCMRYVEKTGGPYFVYRSGGKTPIQFVEEAFKPLEKYKDKISVVIDGSTTRGFMVPSAASLYSQHLGIKPNQAFDLTQACNGFSLALQHAYMMFTCKPEQFEGKYIMIINNEQPPKGRGLVPESTNDYKAVASYFVGLTFSNMCTITILEKSENRSWQFLNHDNPQYASHICIGMPGGIANGFLPQCEEYEVSLNEQYGQFCIPKLHQMEEKIIFIYDTNLKDKSFFQKANIITHTFTKSVYEQYFSYEMFQQLCLYYDKTGNQGSCSMPYIIRDNYDNNIPVGQNIAFIANAAGGADMIVKFTHKKDELYKQQGKEYQEIVKKQQPRYSKLYCILRFGFTIVKGKLFCRRRCFDIVSEKADKNNNPLLTERQKQ